jgi:DNA helicase HerA-like ATPase
MADDEIAKLRAAAAAAQAALEAAEREAVEKAAAAEKAAEQREEKPPAAGPLDPAGVDAIAAAYAFEGEALEIGALVNGSAMKDAQIRIPLAMLNRHGLIAGATGTGKTRTLQGLAEQLAEKGVPVFAADMKGDLSGVAVPGETSEKLTARTRQIGQDWQPRAQRTEFFVLGEGGGIPLRATVSGFGPLLLAKVLGLNQTQESSLRLVFHYADENGLALVDLDDLRAVLAFLTSDAGKPELKGIGGISTATAGVILRELSAFAADGADDFFGEPEFDVTDLIRLADDGRGILNLLELPNVQSKPALFSTFLMYLLAELFEVLPEVGDLDKPKLVFFFDEAHLLFADASKDFLDSITQTVRLIRSKGVGVFFITQTPKDIPGDVLAQLGSRVQHALRAFTPNDAKALKATVSTYPTSGYDLERVLQDLGTGEAIVTVMSEHGAPTPVAWTRVRAPQGLMSPAPEGTIAGVVSGSVLRDKYATRVDPESAREILAAKMDAAHAEAERATAAAEAAADAKKDAAAQKAKQKADREYEKMLREITRPPRTRTTARRAPAASPLDDLLGSSAQKLVSGVVRGLFGIGRR